MFQTLKRKIADILCRWIYKNATFPKGCEHGNELAYLFKDNCPYCIENKIEYISNQKYHEKYPAKNVVDIGVFKVYLCDYHLERLLKCIKNFEDSDTWKKLNKEHNEKEK